MKRTLTLLGILAMFFSLTAFFGGKKMTKFEWSTAASAPEHYAMEIIAANLIYGDGDAAYVPGGASIAPGWGTIAARASGDDPRPVPRVLDILFFSYTEDAFYRGKFALPYNKMLAAFQQGYDLNFGGRRERRTFSNITVGVAPGGVVAMWLKGRGRILEVFYDRATKVTLPWDVLTQAKHISRQQYVENIVRGALAPLVPTGPNREMRRNKDAPEARAAYAALKKNGPPFGLWDRLRKRYAWQPETINVPLRDEEVGPILYYNGEGESLFLPLDQATAAATRPVPKQLSFVWKPAAQPKGLLVEIYFNEKEVFDAFEKLGANNQPLRLELKIEQKNGNNSFTVTLKNDKARHEFDHHELKTFTPAGLRYEEIDGR